MNNKFGRAALLAIFATILNYFLALLLNATILRLFFGEAVLYFSRTAPILLTLWIIESIVAVFLSAKFGNKLLFKRNIKPSICAIISVLAGFVNALASLIPLNITLLGYVKTFSIFFMFILIIDKANEKFIYKFNNMKINSAWFKYVFPTCLAFFVFWIAADMIFWKILGAAMAFGLGFLISKWLEKKFSAAKSQSASIAIKIILCVLPILLALIIGFGSKSYDNHKDVFNKDPNKWTDEEKDYVNDFFEWHSNHYDD